MEDGGASDILAQYRSGLLLHQAFLNRVEQLIHELLEADGIKVHSVTARLKAEDSLAIKVESAPSGKYERLADITDICGLRIITYFHDDVDKVAETIAREFAIDDVNSVDKRSLLEADRFGYLSLHYVARLPESRLRLTEFRRFEACTFEVQIRSILQHAWAEIQHDLGYKNRAGVPNDVERRFSRLAGLLELADEEFRRLREDIDAYREAVSNQLVASPAAIRIDSESLVIYVAIDMRYLHFLGEIRDMLGAKMDHLFVDTVVSDSVTMLTELGFTHVEEIARAIDTNRERLLVVARSVLHVDEEAPRIGNLFGITAVLAYGFARKSIGSAFDTWLDEGAPPEGSLKRDANVLLHLALGRAVNRR
jgi:putative GTP pyrophosphokinase